LKEHTTVKKAKEHNALKKAIEVQFVLRRSLRVQENEDAKKKKRKSPLKGS